MNAIRTIVAVVAMSLLLVLTSDAGPGQGVWVGSWVLSPYIDLNSTFDSNVYKTRDNEIADVFVDPELGVRYSSSTETNRVSISGNIFYSRREYVKEKDLNFHTLGDVLTLRYNNEDRTRIELIQSYRMVQDNDRHASDIENSDLSVDMVQDVHTLSAQRDVNQFGAGLDQRVTDKTDLSLAYRFSGITYDEDAFLDLDGHLVQAEAALDITEKTRPFLSLLYGIQNQEGMEDSATLAATRLGFSIRGSEKLTCRVAAGAQHYVRPSSDSQDETATSFSFDTSADWFATEKITLRGGGYNGTQLSSFYAGNGLDYISGWLGVGYRWNPSTTFSMRGIYRKDDYLDLVYDGDARIDRVDQRAEGHARIDYIAPTGFIRLYIELSQDIVDSNIDTVDYIDTRVIFGANIRY